MKNESGIKVDVVEGYLVDIDVSHDEIFVYSSKFNRELMTNKVIALMRIEVHNLVLLMRKMSEISPSSTLSCSIEQDSRRSPSNECSGCVTPRRGRAWRGRSCDVFSSRGFGLRPYVICDNS